MPGRQGRSIMNTKEHEVMKMRGSADVSYLGQSVDSMIWEFMKEKGIPGLTLAIVQAPYIPRVVGYGLSDRGERRLASANTMWPTGPISQAFAAVAVMQLFEDGKLRLEDRLGDHIPEVPEEWYGIEILQLLRHGSGIPDYLYEGFDIYREWEFREILELIDKEKLHFVPGTDVEWSASNFLMLTEIVERISGESYHDFVTERQIQFLGLGRTGFAEDLKKLQYEEVSLTGNIHQLFKNNGKYIDPTEPAASYDRENRRIKPAVSSALRGVGDIWASAQDISFWDIGLAGGVLIHEAKDRKLIYAPWNLPDGREVPGVAGWQFYKHRGLMDIKGSVPGYSSFLSRFTHSDELVCVTLLANKEGIDFTNLARRIAGAFGDLLSTNYDDNNLYLFEGQFPVEDMVRRLEDILREKKIPVFAKFDHAKNAKEAGLTLRPTTVVVFGAPKVGTELMQEDQSISLELPLRISIWEDETGSTWLAFPRMGRLAERYGLGQHPVTGKMQALLEELVRKAGSIYS